MKTMNNFVAQQLSKKQMNEVKGGEIRHYLNCMIVDVKTGKTVEWSHSTIGNTLSEATNNMLADLKDGQRATDCHTDYIFT